ncbi:MAG: amidohydrolase family protein [Desulfovibrio sp.]
MILDALTHISRDGDWFNTGLDASLPVLLASMDQNGVDRAVLAGIPGAEDDDLLLAAVRTHPGRFLAVAGVDVCTDACADVCTDTFVDERGLSQRLEEVKALGFSGIKLHPRFSGVPVTDPRIRKAVRLTGKLGLTALVCTIHRPPLPPLGRPVSDALYELCRDCDDTRIILMHGGYTDLLATSELIRPLEHVLLDLSTTLPRFHAASTGLDIRFLLETFDRRLCVGSDFPEGDMARIRELLLTLGEGLGTVEALMETLAANTLRFFPACSEDA